MKGTSTLTFSGGGDKVTDVKGWRGGSLGTVIDGRLLTRTVALLVARLVGVVVAVVLGTTAWLIVSVSSEVPVVGFPETLGLGALFLETGFSTPEVVGFIAVGLVLVPWVRLGSLTGVAVGWLMVSCVVGML